MIIRNSKFKQVIPDNFTYKGTKYTKAYYKDEILFAYTDDDYAYQYFTIESLEDGNVITLTIGSGVTSTQMTSFSYSVDNGATWNTTTVDSTTQTINVNLDKGEKVLWKGIGNQLAKDNLSGNTTIFSSTKNYIAYGNIASLLFGDNFSSINSFANGSSYNYASLFFGSNKLKNIDNLVLPFTSLTSRCYSSTFRGTGIIECKLVLPATTIAQAAYENMFRDCTSLTTAPKMYVTSFSGSNNMQYMFGGCSSLIEAPELPATTLVLAVYQYMFGGCTSLTKAPELPATTLTNYCYRNMFNGCTSLNYIKCLATNISATDCTTNWVNNVASTGTFIKADTMNDWTIDSVNGIPIGWTIQDYAIDYEQEYFTILSQEDSNVITLSIPAALTTSDMTDISYSTDNGATWTTTIIDGTAKTISVTLNKGQKAIWKGNGNRFARSTSGGNFCSFSSTQDYNVYGNIMSLLNGDNFYGTTLSSNRNFTNFFINNTHLKTIENLVLPSNVSSYSYQNMFYGCTGLVTACKLPATSVYQYSYDSMFQNCSSLVSPPDMDATSVSNYSFNEMFYGCTSLTTAPKLPATTLAPYCYTSMFQNCTSLTEAPELLASTLVSNCYKLMFSGCTSLSYIKCLATDISATNCTTNWVGDVAPTGTFVKADGMNDWVVDSVNGIPIGWTDHGSEDYSSQYFTIESLEDGNSITLARGDNAPEINAYYSLDNGATWVQHATSATKTWVLNTGDKLLIKATADAWATNWHNYSYFKSTKQFDVYGNIMSLLYGNNFVNQTTLNSAGYNLTCLFINAGNLKNAENLILPATTLAQYCYRSMFQGCTSLVTAPELPATALTDNCYEYMFAGCKALATGPQILATSVTINSCYGMFDGCTNMTTIPDLHITAFNGGYFHCAIMFRGCTSLTKAPALPAINLAWACYAEMFNGCTSLETAPDLPATSIGDQSYENMFVNCIKLTSIKVYAPSNSYGTLNFGSGLPASGTYYVKRNAGSTILNACPSGWTLSKTL